MITSREIIMGIIILVLLPFIIFGYAVNFSTIDHLMENDQILKDEICRLNKIIEDLKDNQRGCFIPSVEKIIKPNINI